MSVESENKESDQRSNQIDQLSAVVQPRGGRIQSTPLFVGWAADGRPMVATSGTMLSEAAQKSFRANQSAGLPIHQIDYREVTAVNYGHTGEAIDYTDTPGRPAEDLIVYSIKDQENKSVDAPLGERAILDAIVNSSTPWQDAGRSRMGDVAVAAKPMYTLFVPTPEMIHGEALAVLFPPLIPRESNEATYKSFVRNTLGRLLVLDESQPRENMKGYLQAAKRHAGLRADDDSIGALVMLKKLGIVDFNEGWMDKMAQQKRNMGAGLLKFARDIGLVDVSDDMLDNMRQPLPNYNIDDLKLSELLGLVSDMSDIAHNRLR